MNNWNDILQKVSSLYKENGTLWFRGHSNTEYKLNSSLHRITNETNELNDIEMYIFNSFINYGDRYCTQFTEYKNWYILFLMQHYGLYTRLLDWTNSFATALYFANLNRKPDQTGCIWVLDPIELNKDNRVLYKEEDLYINSALVTLESLPKRIENYKEYFEKDVSINSFALLPRRSNGRLVSQNGFFTVQGTYGKPLEEEYNKGSILQKIELTPEIYEESNIYLQLNGINYYSLFGGVEGICKHIKDNLNNKIKKDDLIE